MLAESTGPGLSAWLSSGTSVATAAFSMRINFKEWSDEGYVSARW